KGVRVLETLEADELDLLLRPRDRLALAHRSLRFDAENDVAEDRAPRKKSGLLEHHRAVAAWAPDLAPVKRQAAAGDRDKAVDRVEECRLSAPRRADDGEKLARAHLEVHALHRGEQAARTLQPVLDDDPLRGELRGAVVHPS